MNKVITINLNGVAYQLEEGGYDALRAYLDRAARGLEGNPDRDEIMTDIEQAIADKFRALLGAYKTVVNAKEVAAVLDEMGPVQDDSAADATTAGAAQGQSQSQAAAGSGPGEGAGGAACPRRLYRIADGAMLAGVCNGLGAYLNIDATFIRLAFLFLTFFWGAGALVYLVMAIVVPEAKTSAEKAAAAGMAATAQEFINRARAGYYEGMRAWHGGRHERRAWRRQFKRDMRAWKYGFHHDRHAHAQQWQQQHRSGVAGPVFVAPLLSILLFGAAIAMIYGICSLASSGAAFGVPLPANMPLWVGILIVVFAYGLVSWPLKAARWACYYHGPYGGGLFGSAFWSLVGLFFLAFGVWSLNRHVPEFHEWLVQLPDLLHRLIDTVKGWFASKG